jgi:hypothetical protein
MNRLVFHMVLVGSLGLGVASWSDMVQGAGVSVEQATAPQKKDAQAKFEKAMKEYEAKRLDKALEAFRDSYNTVASPNSHYMVARTLRDLGKLSEAAAEYQGVIDEAKADQRYAETLASANSEFEELKARLAFVTVQLQGAPDDATVEMGGTVLDKAKLGTPIIVEPGDITVRVRSSKGDMEKSVAAAGGKTETVLFDLTTLAPPPVAAPPSDSGQVEVDTKKFGLKQWAYVAGGVGAAGLLTFGVFGLMNNAKHSSLEDACPGGHCPPEKSGDIDSGKTYQTVANVGLVVGIVGVGTGAALYVLGSKKKPAEQPAATAKMPQVMVGPGSVLVTGRF